MANKYTDSRDQSLDKPNPSLKSFLSTKPTDMNSDLMGHMGKDRDSFRSGVRIQGLDNKFGEFDLINTGDGNTKKSLQVGK